MDRWIVARYLILGIQVIVLAVATGKAAVPDSFEKLGQEFEKQVHPLLVRRCITCHSKSKKKGKSKGSSWKSKALGALVATAGDVPKAAACGMQADFWRPDLSG